MHEYKAYKVEDILRLTIRNYIAIRQHIPRLKSKDLADATRAHAYGQAKDVNKIINSYDPPIEKQ